MQTIVVGKPQNHEEFKQKFPDLDAILIGQSAEVSLNESSPKMVWDFSMDEDPASYTNYVSLLGTEDILLANLVKTGLANLFSKEGKPHFKMASFNGLPGLFNRPLLEISLPSGESGNWLQELMNTLEIDYQLVDDRVGMVTPRVIFMIINEAFYTLQEGTASKKDIDLGMKLGTNYPHGPFEWAEIIGYKTVYETLDALWQDSREERYKICPLLKKEYLSNS
jgi:3-hydroxybutyryl-CoA dehydrogenase